VADVRDETPSIGLVEIADVLRRVMRGQTTAAVMRGSDTRNKEPGMRFVADGFTISMHLEAESLDYVEWAEAPDGRYCAFDDWYQAAMKADLEVIDPLEMLTENERAVLQSVLSGSPSVPEP
jgi:hypothetical protein